MRRIYWASEALAPLVRESRANHDRRYPKCDMVDIERLETKKERDCRLNPQPTAEQLGEGFC
jgi:hypothetical protein